MLKVNEIFGETVQGEGRTLGKKVFFLRLAMCNLHCVWCDSKQTWDWNLFDRTKEVHEMSVEEIIEALQNLTGDAKALVISGGEPLLQQKQLVPLIKKLKGLGWWIEVETNGTVKTTSEFLEEVDQVNCSPKLSNCGDSKKARVRNESLKILSASEKVYFKFVVANEVDLQEVEEYIKDFSMRPEKIYLMPLGKTRDELLLTVEKTKALAKEYSLNYSPRLHIELWNDKRGV